MQRVVFLQGSLLGRLYILQLYGLALYYLLLGHHGPVDKDGALAQLLAAYGVPLVKIHEIDWNQPRSIVVSVSLGGLFLFSNIDVVLG